MTGPSSTDPSNTDREVGSWKEPEWMGYVPLVVDAHVRSGSEMEVVLHPQEGRVVLTIAGANNAAVHLFTPRAELVRLIEVASAALAELDAHPAMTEQSVTGQFVTDANTAGVDSAA